MKPREILIYYAVICKGDWVKIFESLSCKKHVDEDEAKKVVANMHSKAVTILDDDYPEQLKWIKRPPFVLFYHGDLSIIKDKMKAVSVVGSRENTRYGKAMTIRFVKGLCRDVVIVSGMARGIDGIAHRACIQYGGKTVAVLGCGINVCYPPKNLDIYDEVRKNHLVLSEYPDLTQPSPYYFPVRNRIIAALSNCLLVTEGQKNSGTSITATLTLEDGGNVCCVPTKVGSNSLCNYLISYGACLVETPEDVLFEMDFHKKETAFEKSEN